MSVTILTVGSDKEYTTINAAILAANQMGGNADIQVDAGTYVNDGGALWDGVNNVTIEGVGGDATIVDPSYNAGGKAAIVTGGQNIVLRNLDISDVQVSDGNGAAVRYDQGTLTLDNVHLHDNQNGILSAADPSGSITIENSELDHNGVGGNGHTHDIYIGNIANFTLTDSYVDDAEIGHEVKSRADNNTITNNVIADNDESASYDIDLPNGGNATITGNTIEQGPNTQNSSIDAYGEEGATNPGNTVVFSDNTVINDGPQGALWTGSGGNFTGSGNTLYNVADLGQAGSIGYTDASSRPALTETPYANTTPVSSSTDTIVVSLSEDAWQSNAMADLLVDGRAVLRDQTVTASHAAGQTQQVTLTVPSAASHVLSVAFTNDAYGGSPQTDRNLYIDGISVNGVATGQSAPEDSGGIESFTIATPASPAPEAGNPTVSSPNVSVVENTQVALGIAQPSDPHYAVSALTIAVTGLPSDGSVTLSDGTTPVTSGEMLTAGQLSSLLFTPIVGLFDTTGTFAYTVTDPAGNSGTGIATLAIGDATDAPPTADSPLPDIDPNLSGCFSVTNVDTDLSGGNDGTGYTGSDSSLQHQFIWPSTQSVAVRADIPNVFIQSGSADDALQVTSQSNILDGGAGSNFLVGATGADGGTDQFYVDASGPGVTWNTLVNFHLGDEVTIWGFQQGVSTDSWTASAGAAGYQGATLNLAIPGAGARVTASITFAGMTQQSAATALTTNTSTEGGRSCLQITYT